MKSILLFGGSSEEKLVSVASAQNLSSRYPFDALWFLTAQGQVFEATAAELAAHERPFEKTFVPAASSPLAPSLAAAVDRVAGRVVFMGLHGTEGEDGGIQGLFEKNRISFTGSGAESSRNCFDKIVAKKITRKAGIRVADELILRVDAKADWEKELRAFFARAGKCVVKPVASGSSFGLHILKEAADLERALPEILKAEFGDFLCETFLEGRELTVGVHEDETGGLSALPASEVVLNAGHSFDYQGKYLGRGTTEITPARLTAVEMAAAQELAVQAHRALGCRGYTRTDMILTSAGPVFLETNTLPGMSRASFIPQQLEAAGIPVAEFLETQIRLASRRFL